MKPEKKEQRGSQTFKNKCADNICLIVKSQDTGNNLRERIKVFWKKEGGGTRLRLNSIQLPNPLTKQHCTNNRYKYNNLHKHVNYN